MRSIRITPLHSLLDFEGLKFEGIVRSTDRFRRGSTIWCSAGLRIG
ncbi:hypothetical protein [Mesorhizobium prunaredense]|nr:hypothetical protein [Mesorhizobium prunaredense]